MPPRSHNRLTLMGIPSTLFDLQIQSIEDAERWILVLVQALREKGKEWRLTIAHLNGGVLSFECEPALTNEEVSEALVSRIYPNGRLERP